jgi:NAD(P)-dependent dehydrogenase (short-subunit alcohol dehydrogenase family)
MEELRFDGQVAIVTGAGGNPSLGRSYALLLAERGARVVVNDLGTGPDGRSVLPASAESVVQEIRDAGGEAVADGNSVAENSTAAAIVQTALDTWGRVDVLVNNAGMNLNALFDQLTASDLQKIVDVHLMGNIWMCRAVWPHMKAAGYGRIINVSSANQLGKRYTVVYGGMKAGILGLTRGLAAEGMEHGIKVNALAPDAGTAAVAYLLDLDPTSWRAERARTHTPELVAPVVAVLAHEQCPVSGALIQSGGGKVTEWFLSETEGYENPELIAEDVLENWSTVTDRSDPRELPDPITLASQPMGDLTIRPYEPA